MEAVCVYYFRKIEVLKQTESLSSQRWLRAEALLMIFVLLFRHGWQIYRLPICSGLV